MPRRENEGEIPTFSISRAQSELCSALRPTVSGDTIRGAAYKTDIRLGTTDDALPERVFCNVHEQYCQITHDLITRRLDKRIITKRTVGRALPAGSSPLLTLPERHSMLDPDFPNYTDHYRVLYPYATVTYPADFCGLLE